MSWFKRLLSASAFTKTPGAPKSAQRATPEPRGNSPEDHAQRKSQRALLREQLHSVVRECMGNAGVLSSHYKFKVLTVNRESTQFVVMVDMLGQIAPDRDRLSQLETNIAQKAMSMRGMRVIAVYWRLTEQAALSRPKEAQRQVDSTLSRSRSERPAATRVGNQADFPDTNPRALGGTQYGDLA